MLSDKKIPSEMELKGILTAGGAENDNSIIIQIPQNVQPVPVQFTIAVAEFRNVQKGEWLNGTKQWELSNSLSNIELDGIDELIGLVCHRGIIVPSALRLDINGGKHRGKSTIRVKENFKSMQVIVLDDDKTANAYDFWSKNKFFQMYGAFAHPSSSSIITDQKVHAFFVLDEPIMDYETARSATEVLYGIYGHVDRLPVIQLSYDSKRTPITVPYKVLSTRSLLSLIDETPKYKTKSNQGMFTRGKSVISPNASAIGLAQWWGTQMSNRNKTLHNIGCLIGEENLQWQNVDFLTALIVAGNNNGYLKEYGSNDPNELVRILIAGVANAK